MHAEQVIEYEVGALKTVDHTPVPLGSDFCCCVSEGFGEPSLDLVSLSWSLRDRWVDPVLATL